MGNGMSVTWIVGEREPVMQVGAKGAQVSRLGKNQGPVFKQTVQKVYAPR